ncbi:MAG: hypothetical protein IM624_06600 [Phenylobacterium sp.]|uniref:hypothetical protein n=1 Tax=Phenylobacterium sp. TaxID=1871053 RepID=UPI0025E0F8AE|nr:hypothetical protein [Phenylobacterium sp.]MCA6298855.1 hypothetical protein [Phenylobacterium sp.]
MTPRPAPPFRSRLAALALGLALAGTGGALAAPAPQDDPKDVRLRELSDRVSDLERALQGLNAQLETTARAGDLARGEVDRLQERVRTLEAGRPVGGGAAVAPATPASATASPPQASLPAPAAPAVAPPAAAPPTPATSTAAPSVPPPAAASTAGPVTEDGLTRGRKQLQGGDPAGAEATLTTWLAASPGDPRVGEGTYLRGRARALQSAWPDAATDYIAALKGWPTTWWGPDAVVELARSLARLGKTAEACQALAELGVRYSTAPEGARKRAEAISTQARCGT